MKYYAVTTVKYFAKTYYKFLRMNSSDELQVVRVT